MKKYKNSNIFLYVSGFFLLILALFLIIAPFNDYASNIITMSFSLIVIGISFIIAFVLNKKWYFRPGWILPQGFYLIFIGILCLYSFKKELSDSMNLIFAMWALFSGVTQISASIQLRSLEFIKWHRMTFYGIINLLFFIYFITDPFSVYVSLYTSFGIYILISGMICLAEPFIYKSTL